MATKRHIAHKTLIRPRITEKGSQLAGRGVYSFEVATSAGKHEIMEAIHELYGVRPVGVRIVPIKSKVVTRGAQIGRTAKRKKAYIYVKEGDKIEFV